MSYMMRLLRAELLPPAPTDSSGGPEVSQQPATAMTGVRQCACANACVNVCACAPVHADTVLIVKGC